MLEHIQTIAVKFIAAGPNQGPNQSILGDEAISGTDLPTGTFNGVISNVIVWALSIAGGLAVLILIIGGVLYVTASGNQTRLEQAKTTIKGAIIGIVVILLSAVIVYAIQRAIL